MGARRFLALLRGLSGEAVYRQLVAAEPQVMTSDEARAALKSM